jgi:hypothetical protein
MNLRESILSPGGLEICVTRRQWILDRRYRYPSTPTVDLRPAERRTARIGRLLKMNHSVTVGRVNTARLLDMCGNHG